MKKSREVQALVDEETIEGSHNIDLSPIVVLHFKFIQS